MGIETIARKTIQFRMPGIGLSMRSVGGTKEVEEYELEDESLEASGQRFPVGYTDSVTG